MVAVAAGEVSPRSFGNVYCIAIEGCQEIARLRPGRRVDLGPARWCASQPGLVAFTGQCSVHRGQVMRLRGAWRGGAGGVRARAAERYRLANTLDADRPGRGRARRRAPAAGRVRRGRGGLPARRRARLRPAARARPAVAGARSRRRRRGRRTPAGGGGRRPGRQRAGCCPQRSTCCSPATRSTRPARPPAELDQVAVGRRLRSRCTRGGVRLGRGRARRRRRRQARCPTCARRASSGRGSSAPTRSRGSGSLTGRALAALGDEESARRELERGSRRLPSRWAPRPTVDEVARLLEPRRLPAA